MSGKITPAKLKRKKFVDGVISGKSATQAYRDAYPKASYDTARTESSTLLSKPDTQEEIARRLSEITPESVLTRIDDLARSGKPSDSVRLRALELLGNTRKASVFKDLPQVQVNTLNVLDVDELRKRLEDHDRKELSA